MRASWQHYGTYDESAYPELWDGVVGYWAPCLGPTGTRLHDVSRYNNWGTLTNMDAATDWVVDGGQYALDFDGAYQEVNCGAKVPRLGAYHTMAGWFKPSLRDSRRMLCGMCTNIFAGGIEWAFSATTFDIAWTVTGANIIGWISGPLLPSTQWIFACAVYRLGTVTMTANSTTSTVSSSTSPILYNNDDFRIAAAHTNPKFIGRIDSVCLWNRALSQDEVSVLYNLGRGGMLERRRRRRVYSVQADSVKSYLFVSRGQVIGGGTL